MSIKYLSFLLISLLALSCKKGEEEPVSSATFTITGVRDADLTKNSTSSDAFPLSVTSTASNGEQVTLFTDGLPKGVFASIVPSSGTTPFTSRVTFWNDFTGTGGTFPVTIVGNSPSGNRSYKMNVTLDPYRGWKFGDSINKQRGVIRDQGNSSRYPKIVVLGGGNSQLVISFGVGRTLPFATRTYRITGSAGTGDDIQITMSDPPEIYNATGAGAATGTFTIDSLGKFTFKCKGVEMSNGVQKKILDCNIIER